jgi:hypothetical protein
VGLSLVSGPATIGNETNNNNKNLLMAA